MMCDYEFFINYYRNSSEDQIGDRKNDSSRHNLQLYIQHSKTFQNNDRMNPNE